MSAPPYISSDIEARYEPPGPPPQGRVVVVLSEEFANKVAWGDTEALTTLRNVVGSRLVNYQTPSVSL